MSNQMTSYTK